MTHILSLGAINKLNGEYVYPKIANKKDEYICPECNKDLILCQGEVRVHHFRHKVDNINPCNHYSNPTETQIHKDAKLLLKKILERKTQILFIRNCCCCKKKEEFEIPEMSETSVIEIEYRFEYNGVKIADVAYIDNGELVCIFEICNTHKTCSENRPEPWFEMNAETLIHIANENSLKIPCIRCEKCEDCMKLENVNLKYNNIEKYVRIKLGQKYPIPDYESEYSSDEYGGNIYDLSVDTHDEFICLSKTNIPEHIRFNFVDFHYSKSRPNCILNNEHIINLFEEDFINKKIAIYFDSKIYIVYAYIISNIAYKKYNYWNDIYYIENDNRDDIICYLPYEKRIDVSNESTISIIIKLIEYCRNAYNIKQERIKKIKQDIIHINNKKEHGKKEYVNDDADIYRLMRYTKQDNNRVMSLTQELTFIENDIPYILGNNVITITHSKTQTQLKRSLVNNKTLYKGTWRNDISVKLIINWYNSHNDILDEL
jgi:competence CoiA-like predicted nuclease